VCPGAVAAGDGQVAGLHLQRGLGEAHVAAGDEWQVCVVLLVDRVTDVRTRVAQPLPDLTCTFSLMWPTSSVTS
jgi:hypothetical protein